MKNFKRMIGTAIAVGLAMVVFGCGGSGFLSESPTDVLGEDSYPVSITGGVVSDAGVEDSAGSLNKDVGGEGVIDPESGDISGPDQFLVMNPYINCGNSIADDAPLSPAVELVYDSGDCTVADDCLVLTEQFTDAYMSDYSFNISGTVGSRLAGDTIPCDVVIVTRFGSQQVFADAAFSLNGYINTGATGWPELNADMLTQISDITQFDLTEEAFGATHVLNGYDVHGCDGVTGATDSMLITIDQDPLGNEGSTTATFQMGLPVDPDYGDLIAEDQIWATGNYYQCNFQTIKASDFVIPAGFGSTIASVDLDREFLKECARFCDDKDSAYCDVLQCVEAAMMSAANVDVFDAAGQPILAAATDVVLDPEAVYTSFGEANIVAASVIPANNFLVATAPPNASLDRSEASNILANANDAVDAIAGDDWDVAHVDLWEYEDQTMEMEWVKIENSAGGRFDYAVSVPFTLANCVSHSFHASLIDAGDERQNLYSTGANARFQSDVFAWPTARTFLTDAKVQHRREYFDVAAAADSSLAIGNTLSAIDGDEFRVETFYSSISKIINVNGGSPSTDGDTMLTSVCETTGAANPGYCYSFGLEAYDDGNGAKMYCVFYQWSDASGGWAMDNGVMNATDCDGQTKIAFRFDYSDFRDKADVYIGIGAPSNWVNIGDNGVKHYAALAGGTAVVADMDNGAETFDVMLEFISRDGAGINDNVVYVDYIRAQGMSDSDASAIMYPDIAHDYGGDFGLGW
jgi:hypothetical protein